MLRTSSLAHVALLAEYRTVAGVSGPLVVVDLVKVRCRPALLVLQGRSAVFCWPALATFS